MKTTIVPAQITTVEDRIAGNLTFSQIILLIIPLLIGTLVYVAIAPFSRLSSLKLILITVQFLFFGAMAIRIKGKLLVDWLVIYIRFHLRPRIYVFTKTDQSLNESPAMAKVSAQTTAVPEPIETPNNVSLSPDDQSKLDALLENPALTVRFSLAKKGGIDVSLAAKEK